MNASVVEIVRNRHFGGDPAFKRVIEYLAETVADDGTGVFPKMDVVAADCELQVPTVQRVLRQARDRGLLSVAPARDGVLRLLVHVDALLAVPLTEAGRRRFAAPRGGRL